MGGRHRRGGEVVQKLAPHVAELNCIWATSWIFKTTFIIPTNDFPPIKQASRQWHHNDIWVLSIYNLQFASNINIWGLFFFFCTRARSMKQRKALPTLPLVSAAVVHLTSLIKERKQSCTHWPISSDWKKKWPAHSLKWKWKFELVAWKRNGQNVMLVNH